jgi:prefoldin subunit 5
MLKLLRKLQGHRASELSDDILAYKRKCEGLVQEYESLLDRISNYMQTQERLLGTDAEPPVARPAPEIRDDTSIFRLLQIKEELGQITRECDDLMSEGRLRPKTIELQEEAMSLLLGQLQSLRQYSDQIEEALLDFEEKLLELEEVASTNALCN